MLCRSIQNHALLACALCVALMTFKAPLTACQVPVFRYALENWEPDRLEVFVVHDGPLTDDQRTLCDRLEAACVGGERQGNFRWHAVDATAQHAAGSLESLVVEQCGDQPLPQLQVYFSMSSSPQPVLAWATSFDAVAIDQLLTSPKRDEVVKRLLDGQSGVWILLKCGKAAADQQAEELLRRELAKKPAEIELPSLTDLAQEEKFDATLGVQLRVEFSLLTIDPTEESEAFFRSMLINTEPDLKDFDEPIAIPIYGRGRTFFALVGPGITADNISDNCNFMCGACSCEIKSQNPGHDLLLAANWQQVEPGNWVNDTPLPALTGIGQLDEIVSGDVTAEDQVDDPAWMASAATSEANAAAIEDENSAANLVAMREVESHDDAVRLAAGPQAVITVERTSALPMIVMGWIGLLLCLGLGFTLWRRSRSTE